MRSFGRRTSAFVALVAAAVLIQVDAVAVHRSRAGEDASEIAAPVELVGLPPHYEEVVDWALTQYDEAGLNLPPLRIVHHGDDPTPCRGSTGLHHCDDAVSVIDLCTTESGKLAERLVLHELAHAWAEHELDDQRKARFQALRGWTEWSAEDGVSWSDRGCEQAAEIIASGVSDRPIPTVLWKQAGCEDFDRGYRVLTGTAPPHGVLGRCSPSVDRT